MIPKDFYNGIHIKTITSTKKKNNTSTAGISV